MPQSTFYGRKKIEIAIQPNIGLDAGTRQSVVELLNLLLADEAVLSGKTINAERDAVGAGVPDLQSIYATQRQQIQAISSEIGERIQILGDSPTGSTEKINGSARLDGTPDVVPDVVSILADHEAFIRFLREDAQKCSEAYEDQGTYALLVNVMRLHEKMAWTLRTHLAPRQFDHKK